MRRKIIRQGNHSYTLTLPIEWVRELSLDEGSEVELKQEGNDLLVIPSTLKKRLPSTISVNLKELEKSEERTIRNILNQAYRKGYDKIVLQLRDKQELKDVKEIVKSSLLGFEVVEEKESNCVVQSIAEPSSENYQAILRKLFFIIQEEGNEIFLDFAAQKVEKLDERKNVKDSFDNYTNFLRRIIARDKIGGSMDSYLHYVIVSRMSLVEHAYYYMYKRAAKEKKLSVQKKTLKFLEETNSLFKLLHQALFEKDFQKTHEVGVQKEKLIFEELYQLLEKSKGIDNIILYHCGEIIRLTHMISTNIFGLIEYKEQ